ncbi:MAG: NAD(P)H-dependent oxidoreductase subunit E [Caldilineaceae bacterium]|nr:NAD(P)H-dependent oxidoreductase subunit E [Caldilineaceae bacterium]MBP8109251.1 NAD(P)H-dependent oxidoreductase subunit E [Caldilineaceae bacterium]MBP8122941.1 NAD(P)H-dependent oxidoreductase subunit E [Caldilineaceae bacterium]MBP9073065.1 NAD(P)H-dependent oxidoreductase subunit E [Caldilineaceae bacterium]
MPHPSDQELIDRWREEPAPLLPILHAFHDRDGYLSDAALTTIALALRIPVADLFGTVTFYHHFSREVPGQVAPRVCTGPVCCLRGGEEMLAALAEAGATSMPCAGRCDEPVPVLRGHTVLVGTHPEQLAQRRSALPAPNPGGLEEIVFRHIRALDRNTLAGYRRSGGYVGLEKTLAMRPAAVIQTVRDSNLAGRGGAGFPTGLKWKAVRDAAGEAKYVVCNADEGEPGCFKDRAILDHDPHAVIEGMVIAGYATGASIGFLYLRYEYPETAFVLERALDEAKKAGLLGQKILGTGYNFEIYLRRGAGAYICGEETSLLNSLEGKHPFPRNRPPYPVTHGFEDKPTAVNNVETLASIPHILRKGAEWYNGLGTNGQVGTKIISLSGDIRRPGNYEVPLGLPLKTLLYDWAGGPLDGHTIQAVTMAGLSGGFLAGPALDEVTLDEASLRKAGTMLAAGGIMVFDDSREMVAVAHNAMSFFQHESCGKCFPCRIGTQRLTERLNGGGAALTLDEWHAEVADLSDVMRTMSACGLGMAAPNVSDSLVKYFPEQVEQHVTQRSGS